MASLAVRGLSALAARKAPGRGAPCGRWRPTAEGGSWGVARPPKTFGKRGSSANWDGFALLAWCLATALQAVTPMRAPLTWPFASSLLSSPSSQPGRECKTVPICAQRGVFRSASAARRLGAPPVLATCRVGLPRRRLLGALLSASAPPARALRRAAMAAACRSGRSAPRQRRSGCRRTRSSPPASPARQRTAGRTCRSGCTQSTGA